MTTQQITDMADYQVDLDVDFANEDETGYIWVFLDEAREPENIVHIELLPGAVEEYQAAITRLTAHRQA